MANGQMRFQPMRGADSLSPPRAFSKARLPDMRAWIGEARRPGNDPETRLTAAVSYRADRPAASGHDRLAAVAAAEAALAATGIDPAGWFAAARS